MSFSGCKVIKFLMYAQNVVKWIFRLVLTFPVLHGRDDNLQNVCQFIGIVRLSDSCPVDRLLALIGKDGIRCREMAASEETAVGGERRRVWRRQHVVLAAVDELRFGYGVATPKEEDDA